MRNVRYVQWKYLIHSLPLYWVEGTEIEATAAAGQRQTRSPLLLVVWWEVTRAIFVSPSEQLLCPCRIDPEWHCRVGSPVPLSAGNPGVPNRSVSPSGSRSTHPNPPSSKTHVVWPTAIFWAAAPSLLVTACVYAAHIYDLVCTCGMTEGAHIGELQ